MKLLLLILIGTCMVVGQVFIYRSVYLRIYSHKKRDLRLDSDDASFLAAA
jgi:hypothetical protein